MALGTLSGMKAQLGITGTDSTRDDALTGMLVGVEAAIKKLCRPFLFEPLTLTDVVLDAPWNWQDLYLPVTPVRSVTSVYYNAEAHGVVANFTSSNLLTAGTDYQLVIDDHVNGWSRWGRLRRADASVVRQSSRRPARARNSSSRVTSRGPGTSVTASPACSVPGCSTAR
jgi:hypothetical protein